MASRDIEVAVVGAGVVGLAHALAAARQGRRVAVFEQDARALGASVRNFGLVWPVGQRPDHYEPALRSREVWLEIARGSDLWVRRCGSLGIARLPEELAVLHEFLDANPAAKERGCRILDPREVTRLSPVVRSEGLLGALWSPTELNVDPRQAIPAITAYLQQRYAVRFEFGTAVTGVDLPHVHTSRGRWTAEQVVVCSGARWDTLYPAEHEAAGLRRCKLQMLRTVPQPDGWDLGPALCSGLSLLHYDAFASAPSVPALRERLDREHSAQRRWGVHVLVSQARSGGLSVGDSHEYGGDPDPFLHEAAYDAMLDYLARFATLPDARVAERWRGVYASGDRLPTHFSPSPGVTVVNGLGGAGMTLSFALAEQLFPAAGSSSAGPGGASRHPGGTGPSAAPWGYRGAASS